MLKIIFNLSELNISQLKSLYEESIQNHADSTYAYFHENLRILNAEQDFFADVKAFLDIEGAAYALWISEGRYVSGIRFEPVAGGCLLTSFETLPGARCKGYGKMLLTAVSQYIFNTYQCDIISHIDERNTSSLKVHRHCGFRKTEMPVIFVDGSVHDDHVTYILENR